MIRFQRAALALCCLVAVAMGSQGPTGAVSASNSLLRSAMGLLATPGTRGGSGRLVALCAMAERLDPHNADLNLLLSNVIYQDAERPAEAAAAASRYLARFPSDHLQGLRWLGWNLDVRQTAVDRLAWLQDQARREDLPAPLRAEAAWRVGEILDGQARPIEARDAWKLAERLDPDGIADTGDPSDPTGSGASGRVRRLLGALRATGGGAIPAEALAETIQALGLYQQAIRFHEHVWALELRGPTRDVSHATALALFNAMLDAGETLDAIRRFEPLLPRFASSVDFRSLLAEAYARNGQAEEAANQIDAIEALYDPIHGTNPSGGGLARQLATFHLLTRPDPSAALRHARLAFKESAGSPTDQRLLGAAEMASGDARLVEQGRRRLKPLLGNDIYASVYLAEHLFAAGQNDTARDALQAGLALGREGPAARRLLALAIRYGVPVPEPPASVVQLLTDFDDRWLSMAIEPAKFLSVTAEPVQAIVKPGQSVEVDVVLRNVGPLPVPIGELGRLQPSVAFVVELSGGLSERFADLPMATWPAPRYLRTGQEVRRRVRLDIGPLGQALARQPLEQIGIRAIAHAAPVRTSDGIAGSVPDLGPGITEIIRTDLLGTFNRDDPDQWPNQYNKVLGWLVADLQQGDLSRRLRATRQIGSLLALARLTERGMARPPRVLYHAIEKPVLLAMLREALSDPSDVVRAEMVAALLDVPLDQRIVEQVSQVFSDPSPLVRLRVAELLGAHHPPGAEPVLQTLSRDSYDLVRWMATSLISPKP
jgi:tetratricopeptide (TPR) repeat protein